MINKPKILSIAAYKFIPANDGGKRAIYFFETYLAGHFDVEIITTGDNKPGKEAFVVNGLLGTSKWRYINFLLFFTLYKKIKREGITILLLEQVYFGWLGILLKLFTGIKLLVRHHNIESLRFKSLHKWWWRIMWLYEKYICSYADLNFFITEEDAAYARKRYKLNEQNTDVLLYGTAIQECPSAEDRGRSRKYLSEYYQLPGDTFIMLFAAAYNYKPNLDALMRIAGKINEYLLTKQSNYVIIICGGGLPAELNNLIQFKDKKIIYAGFVDDINLYYKGADIFLNPVTEGGGIKTKLVEALACGTNVVSMQSGAAGVSPELCNGKLKVGKDGDNDAFAEAILKFRNMLWSPTPEMFYKTFSWNKIVERAKNRIAEINF